MNWGEVRFSMFRDYRSVGIVVLRRSLMASRMMSFVSHCFLSVVCALLVTMPSAFAEKGPLLRLVESEFNFGTVSEGAVVEHVFGIQNAGDTDLTIQRVSASCGCTAAVASSTTVKPGATEQVKVSFNTLGFFGPKTKSVYIVSNSTDKPEATVKLRGIINRGVTITPQRIDFGSIAPSEGDKPLQQQVSIIVDSRQPREVSAVRTFSKYLTVSPIRKEQNQLAFAVSLLNSVPMGEFRERIVVQFKDPKHAAMNIPVIAFVKKDVRLNPATVSFGIIEGLERIERRVVLENRSRELIDIERLVSSHPAVTVDVKERKGSNIVLALQLDPAKTSGDVKGIVEVVTTRPKDGVLSLSVFGVAPPQ
jgi:hypothetical protein